MKAVFKSENKYFQLVRSQFVGVQRKTSVEVGSTKDGEKVVNELVGETAFYPGTGEEDKVFIFSEGADHNQLTLTDPVEIEGMREFIKSRDYLTEITGE